MRRVLVVILILVAAALAWQLYQLSLQQRELHTRLSSFRDRVAHFEEENENLMQDLEYFSESENLAKEFRSQFNYKKPGETLIIVVPSRVNEQPTTNN